MEKINIAELLRDCPKGMELDCPMYDGLEFDRVDEYSNPNFSIVCRVKTKSGQYNFHTFTKYGSYSRESYSKCVIFPKGEATWEGFQRPFKDGDIIYVKSKKYGGVGLISIYKNESSSLFYDHCCVSMDTGDFYIDNRRAFICKNDIGTIRFATEEEKQKLFKAIKDNGYKWNPQEKTLEKLIVPKFKVGDRVKKNKDYISGIVTDIFDDSFKVTYDGGGCSYVQFHYQCDWELVPNKFDITTLKPFESRVLIRDYDSHIWEPAIWGLKTDDIDYPYIVVGGISYCQCIPYEGNEYLLGKTDDCDNFYKTWE